MSTDPLAELVTASQEGDQHAYAKLVEATQSDVYNLALSVLRNQQDAEDAVQDIYLRVWRALPGFRGQARFRTWLYRVALNTCLNIRRSLQQDLRQVDSEASLDQAAGEGESPTEIALQIERRRRLWSHVSGLPEKYRLVIALFYQQQLSYREIAQILALPLGTVKSHLNRARAALAKRLRPHSEARDAKM
jgi:RNA polymerase sigma-70 factor (ECF subfamily)